MDWRTNLHPDGHIYLHGVPYASAHPFTLYNRIEVENTSAQPLHIGKIRFFPLKKNQGGLYEQLVFGLTDNGILEPETTLMVYFFQGAAAGYGYHGKLEIPVLGHRTGIHAHIFTHAASSRQKIQPTGVRSGVFPVFIFEGLGLTIDPPDGKQDKVKDRSTQRGEHLLLSFVDVVGTFHGGPDDPPKPPGHTVFFSYDPVAYAVENLSVGLPNMAQSFVLPVIEAREYLNIHVPKMKNGALEQMLYTTWPEQKEEDALKILLPSMKQGILEQMTYTILPNQPEEDALNIGLPAMKNGLLENKIYTSHTVTTGMHLSVNLPAMRDGILEEI